MLVVASVSQVVPTANTVKAVAEAASTPPIATPRTSSSHCHQCQPERAGAGGPYVSVVVMAPPCPSAGAVS
ncbi:MAG: hypothetical protein LC789_04645 [Actinobacteria bacterium]|nr:hypothetical protein [Actinomycetota bacterium]MCA1719714.1 hypothetical protein [Actinomycetota bacterium]